MTAMGTAICRHCNLRPVSRKGHPYCSKACSNSSRLVPLSERFMRYFKPAGPDECWPWLGTKDRNGYGVIGDEHRRQIRAHRIAYERQNGQIPEGKLVLHACDNPPCCNPAHLRVGSEADNSADRVTRNRVPIGATHGMSKLTETDVREIRRLLAVGRSQESIGRQFGVSQSVVSDVNVGRTWSHVIG